MNCALVLYFKECMYSEYKDAHKGISLESTTSCWKQEVSRLMLKYDIITEFYDLLILVDAINSKLKA